MAAQQPADYAIFSIVVGENRPFIVDISPHKTVAHLKDAIKLKNPAFDNFAAHHLDLYLINHATDGSLIEKAKELLDPMDKLNAVFRGPPLDGIVHILVQPPQTGEVLCAGIRRMTRLTNHPRNPGTKRKAQNEDSELESEDPKPPMKQRRNRPRPSDEPTPLNPSETSPHGSPSQDDAKTTKTLKPKQESLRLAIKEYLIQDIKLPLFQLRVGSDEVKNHISSLEIPVLPSSPHIPSLLLHKLGDWSHELGLADRVEKIFKGIQQM
jgi:Crinkler effector protein N-terminal domain